MAMQYRQRVRWPLGRRFRRAVRRRRPENAGWAGRFAPRAGL